MFKTLLYKELHDNLISLRFVAVLILCTIIIPLSVHINTEDYKSRLNSYQGSLRLYEDSRRTIGDIYNMGAKAFRPPSHLGFLSFGLEIIIPNIAETQTEGVSSQSTLVPNNELSSTDLYSYLHGPFDIAFIVTVAMSFFAIIFTYGSIAGERENGTLKQILSNSVLRSHILLAKVVANYLCLIVPFLVAMLLSTLIIRGDTLALSRAGDLWPDMGLAFIISALFIGVFLNLGILVSSLLKQSASAIVLLLLCWGIFYAVLPKLGILVAQLVYPVKSRQTAIFEKDQIRRDIDKARDAELDKLIDSGEYTSEKHDEITEHFRKQQSDYLREFDSEMQKKRDIQKAFILTLSRFSPVSCYIQPMAEISHTGWLQYNAFSKDVSRFQDYLDVQVYEKERIRRFSKDGILISYDGNLAAPAPRFEFHSGSREEVVTHILLDIVLLVIYNLLFFSGAFIRFIAYDPR